MEEYEKKHDHAVAEKETDIPKLTDLFVYDLSNCPIPDYPNCLETAQSCVHNSSF